MDSKSSGLDRPTALRPELTQPKLVSRLTRMTLMSLLVAFLYRLSTSSGISTCGSSSSRHSNSSRHRHRNSSSSRTRHGGPTQCQQLSQVERQQVSHTVQDAARTPAYSSSGKGVFCSRASAGGFAHLHICWCPICICCPLVLSLLL